MMVYINYPNPKITIHRDGNCSVVRQHHKENQHVIAVKSQTIEKVLSEFIGNKVYKFSANKALNDLWLDISLSTSKHEESFVYVIQTLLSLHYTPFEQTGIYEHCPGH